MKREKRQIILLMTDTTRWDMVGCYGNPDMKTPNIDAMAREGVRYERAYTCQPVCGPARSALFTGVFPCVCGGWTNSVSIYDNMKTIGQRLRDNGIHTAYIGKWHVDGGDYFGLGRCPDGWDPDYWYDMRNYLEELTPEERVKSRNTGTMKTEDIPAEFTFGYRVTQRALDFIECHQEEDFFLVVSYDEPHDPFLCPEPYASMYKDYCFPKAPNVWDTLENKPSHQKVWAGKRVEADRDQLTICRPWYFGCNSFVDSEIGKVTACADRFVPDALQIYTSDHGDMLDSHCISGKGPAGYDEITRIPLIIKGGVKGQVCPFPVSHIDLAPTLMDYMGLPIPQMLQGKSLLKTLENPKEKINEQIFFEFTRYEIDHDGFGGFQPLRAVYDGRYKLIINFLSEDELYDLQQDPYEMENLILSDKHAQLRDKLHDCLLEHMNQVRDPFRGYYWEYRPWRKKEEKPSWSYTGFTRQRENEEYEPRQLDYDNGLSMKEATRFKKIG